VDGAKAGRLARRREYSTHLAAGLRARMQITPTSEHRREAARSARFDDKLVTGRAMVRPAAVATVTVPGDWGAAEWGRRLDAAVRGAGFVPQRLDLAQDAGFVAGVIPVGIGPVQHRTLT
jgi:hypothetical protein